MIDDAVIELLACPVTKQPLRRSTPEELALAKCEHGLTREDGKIVYPIVDHIAMLLAENGIVIRPDAEAPPAAR